MRKISPGLGPIPTTVPWVPCREYPWWFAHVRAVLARVHSVAPAVPRRGHSGAEGLWGVEMVCRGIPWGRMQWVVGILLLPERKFFLSFVFVVRSFFLAFGFSIGWFLSFLQSSPPLFSLRTKVRNWKKMVIRPADGMHGMTVRRCKSLSASSSYRGLHVTYPNRRHGTHGTVVGIGNPRLTISPPWSVTQSF